MTSASLTQHIHPWVLTSSSPPSIQNGGGEHSEGVLEDADVPASSSTVMPSSPALQTPSSVLQESLKLTVGLASQEIDIKPVICGQKSFLIAKGEVVDDLRVFMNPPLVQGEAASCAGDDSQGSSTQSNPRSQLASDTSELCQGEECPEIMYPYSLDTLEAQIRFSRQLDRLLLCLLREQQHTLTLARSLSHCSPNGQTSQPSSSASSSIYAADVSLAPSVGDSIVSPLSASASSSSRISSGASFASLNGHRPSSRRAEDSDGIGSPDFRADTVIAARLAYGSVSDAGKEQDATSVDAYLSSDSQGTRHTAIKMTRPLTPSAASILATPSAPKKTRAHFQIPAVDVPSRHVSHKRPEVASNIDRPEQDSLKPGECVRIDTSAAHPSVKQSAYNRNISTSRTQQPSSDSTVLSKKRGLSPTQDPLPEPRTKAKLLAHEPASLRRATSLRLDPSTKLDLTGIPKEEPTDSIPSPLEPSYYLNPSQQYDSTRYAPTLPVTPVMEKARVGSGSLSPFPVISPSALGPVPRAPASDIDRAEARIVMLMKKEISDRISDGLLPPAARECGPAPLVDSDIEMWRAVGEDISAHGSLKTTQEAQDSESENDTSVTQLAPVLGIEDDFRIEVIEWILNVRRSDLLRVKRSIQLIYTGPPSDCLIQA
jgi:hypothetical protein